MSLARFSSHTFRWLLSSCIFVPSDSSAFWKALDWPSGHQAWAHTAILPSLPSWRTTCRDHLLAEDGNSVSKSTQVLALSTSNKDQFFLRLLHLFFFFPPQLCWKHFPTSPLSGSFTQLGSGLSTFPVSPGHSCGHFSKCCCSLYLVSLDTEPWGRYVAPTSCKCCDVSRYAGLVMPRHQHLVLNDSLPTLFFFFFPVMFLLRFSVFRFQDGLCLGVTGAAGFEVAASARRSEVAPGSTCGAGRSSAVGACFSYRGCERQG